MCGDRGQSVVIITLMTYLVTLPTKSVYCFAGRTRYDNSMPSAIFTTSRPSAFTSRASRDYGIQPFFANNCLESRCFLFVTSVLWAQ